MAKRFITAVIALPEDPVAAREVAHNLRLGDKLHGGEITGVYAGDAITEVELFEQRCGATLVEEVRRAAAALPETAAYREGSGG